MAPKFQSSGYDGDDESRRLAPPTPMIKRKKSVCSCPSSSTSIATATTTQLAFETIHHIKYQTEYRTRTVVSEVLIPETTILKEHWRTHFQDHWTTVTPPTVTQTVVATGYETTVTLPAHTEVSYHYVPCAEEITVIKHLGRLALLSWLLVLAWSIYAFRRRRRHLRSEQIVTDTTNAFHEA